MNEDQDRTQDEPSPDTLKAQISTINKNSNTEKHEDTSRGKTSKILHYSIFLFNPDYQMVFLTLIIAIATIVNVSIFWNESKSTSLQSKASLDATIDNFRLEQRAWVGLGFISTGNLGIGQPFLKEGQRLDASIPFKNSGRSVAKNVKISMTSQLTPNGVDPIKKQQTTTIYNIGVIQPDFMNFIAPPTLPASGVFTKTDIDNIISSRYIVYLTGRITYDDTFNRPHFTNFCMQLSPALISFAACPFYNDAD